MLHWYPRTRPLLWLLWGLAACQPSAPQQVSTTAKPLSAAAIYHSPLLQSYFRHGIGTNSMTIERGQCTFFFMDQCAYTFDLALRADTLEVLWDLQADCLLPNDLSALVEAQGYPKAGMAIGHLIPVSSRSLRFQPYDPKRLYALSAAFDACDTLFPSFWEDRAVADGNGQTG